MSKENISNEFSDALLEKTKLKEPDMYKVLMHNDDYTTMDFVVLVLKKVFHKNTIEANKIMMDIHKKGIGLVGFYTYDIACTKVMQVEKLAIESEFPLKCSVEKE